MNNFELSKKLRIAGILLAVLLLLVTLNSIYYFLGILKVGLLEWLVFNDAFTLKICFVS
jgi:hypothetical protein